jgi:hypothetical protein
VLGPWAASWARQTCRRYAYFGDPSMVTLAYMRLASQHIYTSKRSNSRPALRAARPAPVGLLSLATQSAMLSGFKNAPPRATPDATIVP